MAPKAVYDPSKNASYESVSVDEIDTLEIFPPVGIARLGDSEEEYFFAPEVPGNINPPTPDGNFRDKHQKIRRQVVSSIDLNPMIVLTIGRLGCPLSCLCVQQERFVAGGSQQ
jgi:L-Lysine epsilon oxidase N-terminal